MSSENQAEQTAESSHRSGIEKRGTKDLALLVSCTAAIRCAHNHAGINPERIALWGTSLGGGHVIAVAADDPRLAAVVAQVPFNGFPRRVEGRSAMATIRLLGAMITDAVRGWLGLAPAYIRVVGLPGELAVMASPEAQQAIDRMQSSHWRNEVAPRTLFR